MPWHEDAFLLLPGDGFLLVGPDGVVEHVDRFARELLGPLACPGVGDELASVWPQAADAVTATGEEVELAGPVDLTVAQGEALVRIRVFRTDTGFGLGILSADLDRAVHGAGFTLYDRVLRAINESVIITTAEPFDRPGPVIVYVNDAFLHDSGYAWHEVIGRSPRIMQGPETLASAGREFREAMDRWGSTTVELLNYRKDGSEFWVEIDLYPVADDSGWYTHWVSVQTDVTARKADEVDREARRAMVRAILDSLPSQSALLDPEGLIVATNEHWQGVWRTFGSGPEPTWSGVNYLEVCRRAADSAMEGAADAAAAYEGIRAVLAGDQPSFTLDYEMAVEGAPVWHHMVVLPLRGREGVIVTHADITTRKVAESELGYRATHDVLTGLSNRDALAAGLSEAISQADRAPFAVVLVDLDDFRQVNDAFGHFYGDRMLETAARRLESVAGPDDLLARVGGDEFALVMPNVDASWDPSAACDRIRKALAEPLNLDITTIRMHASYGVVVCPPYAGDVSDLLRDAETAMYVSKEAGRDRWTLFDESHRTSVRARAITQERVRAGLDHGEFVLHFQPFIDLATGETVGAEALLRWNDPEKGLSLPAEFLAAIESGSLIDAVGEFVLDRSLAMLAEWQAQPRHDRMMMSVNVSPRQLGRGLFVRQVQEALARHGIEPSSLGIEVLETSLVTSGALVEAELRELHEMGVRIAIDDFGTGYSALAYLQMLPVDAVKVDRAFVHRSGNPRGARLLRATGEIARAVGAVSIAEGIETQAELAAAQAAGIDWGQGYLLGRPSAGEQEPARSAVPI